MSVNETNVVIAVDRLEPPRLAAGFASLEHGYLLFLRRTIQLGLDQLCVMDQRTRLLAEEQVLEG